MQINAKDGGVTQYGETDPLQHIAYSGSGAIEVELMYGQGKAVITFPEQLDVINKSGWYKIEMTGKGALTFKYAEYPLM